MDLFALILLAALIGVPLIVISLYNGIVGNHNRVKRAWADVLTYERQKTKVLDALQEQAGLYRDHEQSVLAGITRLRSAIAELPVEADGKTLAKAFVARWAARGLRGLPRAQGLGADEQPHA